MKKFLIFVILSFCSFAEIFVKLDDISKNNFIGKGVYTYSNGDKYEGDWFNGYKPGKGVYTYSNGDKYEGDWVNNQRTGNGVYNFSDGSSYKGEFLEDKLNGKGIY